MRFINTSDLLLNVCEFFSIAPEEKYVRTGGELINLMAPFRKAGDICFSLLLKNVCYSA